MEDYRSNLSLTEAADIIANAGHVTVTTHAKPDGDAFGSVVALTAALRGLGRDVAAWFMPPLFGSFHALPGKELVGIFDNDATLGQSDLVVVLDTGARSQLSPMVEQLEEHLPHTLIVDHHLSGDLPARWRYIDGQAAACCEIVDQLLDQLDVSLQDAIIRDALFVGIAADTGWFRFANTRPYTHELAARLLRRGVDHAGLYGQLQQSERPEKLSLMIRALDSLQLLAGGTVALMVLNADDFRQTGARISDAEQFVDIPQIVGGVQTVVLISQPATQDDDPPPAIRISFRSKPGPGAVNVAELAARFGGGGHARAAGAKMTATLEQVVRQVTDAVAPGDAKN